MEVAASAANTVTVMVVVPVGVKAVKLNPLL
jgi:hypothetical protein